MIMSFGFFFFKQKTAYEMRISDWSSDVCSSDLITTMAIDFLSDPEIETFDLSSLLGIGGGGAAMPGAVAAKLKDLTGLDYIEGYGQIGSASCRERGCQYV